jgi:hypothetical protein
MTDLVHAMLEDMVLELEDYKKKRIFNDVRS